MDALQLLQNRVSITKLVAPAPDEGQLLEIFKAATRAPDHGKLQPWRFLVIEGDGLNDLSSVLVNALVAANPEISPSIVEKTKNMPFRAPMIIISIAKCQDHPKVPKQEQLLACGAATQNILNALFSLNFGAVWRTGDLAYDANVKQALGLEGLEEIIGFIYVGTPAADIPAAPETDVTRFFAKWPDK
ncbi:nitroreductase [Cellvibrio zantedeschiae]|uniref:Putative NAD(P)H nitroreductase n=1 Tax=Cellvibrio zantedeschiae TaxID=1237077 RepID=A0ABQ3AY96_9GAMM|nr:nitroreductase [Cellvibrio zantedeschiae]GGY68117.1 nitroreductase [Cellvibrio zantedeschiae]